MKESIVWESVEVQNPLANFRDPWITREPTTEVRNGSGRPPRQFWNISNLSPAGLARFLFIYRYLSIREYIIEHIGSCRHLDDHFLRPANRKWFNVFLCAVVIWDPPRRRRWKSPKFVDPWITRVWTIIHPPPQKSTQAAPLANFCDPRIASESTTLWWLCKKKGPHSLFIITPYTPS